jgi:hypothetical protein
MISSTLRAFLLALVCFYSWCLGRPMNNKSRQKQPKGLRIPQTARYSREQEAQIARESARNQQQFHGQGGNYDSSYETSSDAPIFHEFIHANPENIASHNVRYTNPLPSYSPGSSSSHAPPDLTTLDLFDTERHRNYITEAPSASSSRVSRGDQVELGLFSFQPGGYVHPEVRAYSNHLEQHQGQISASQNLFHPQFHQPEQIQQAHQSFAMHESTNYPQHQHCSVPHEIRDVHEQEEEEKDQDSDRDEYFHIGPRDLLWPYRDADAIADLVEIISKRRGLRKERAEHILAQTLTKSIENGLLSSVRVRLELALKKLCNDLLPAWMEGVPERNTDALVEQLSFITGQDKISLRAHFLESQMKPDLTALLVSVGDQGLIHYAREYGLGLDPDVVNRDGQMLKVRSLAPKADRWTYYLNTSEQRTARLMVIAEFQKSDDWAYMQLRAPRIPAGFGKVLLACSRRRTKTRYLRLMAIIKDTSMKPSWYDAYLNRLLLSDGSEP